MKRLERAALWAATGLSGIGAVCFAINAGAALLNHPERTGELYGMATAAAILAFVTSHLRSVIRDRAERDRAASLGGGQPLTLIGAGPASWQGVAPVAGEPVRAERDCRYCAERILVAARLCKHCRSDVSSV